MPTAQRVPLVVEWGGRKPSAATVARSDGLRSHALRLSLWWGLKASASAFKT